MSQNYPSIHSARGAMLGESIRITQCEYTCTCAVVMKWITDLKEEEKNWLYIFKMCSNLIKLDFNKQNG